MLGKKRNYLEFLIYTEPIHLDCVVLQSAT